jgi:putative copper export protein/mono/diheme cytochrome c family protein
MITALTVARALHFAAVLMLEGAVVFRFAVSGPAFSGLSAGTARVRMLNLFLSWTIWCGLLVGLASGAAWLVLLAAHIVHIGPWTALSRGVARTVLTRTQFGQTWQVRLLIAVLFAASAMIFDRTPSRRHWVQFVSLLLAIALAGSLAWAGHGTATLGAIGDAQLVGDVLHLVVAGIWVGGLLPLAVMLAIALRAKEAPWTAVAENAARRFSILGIVSVLTLLVTGLINTYVLSGSIPSLLGTPYGRLVLLKITLFATMVGIAAVNRQYLTPRLAPVDESGVARRALAHLVRNSLAEFTLGLLTLGIVGVLGTLTPGLHEQPVWPLPIRFSADGFEDPELRAQTLTAVAAISIAVLAALAAIWWRSWRWYLLAGAIILVAGYFAPALVNLTEPAYPTSFYGSPTGFSAKSIALGHDIFIAHCAVCHGALARGDGPAAPALPVKPADLTAEHIYGHLDGDLFWWIGHGIGGVMPAFGAMLSEDDRWNLIDFIHANADALRLRRAAGRITGFGYPLPNFSIECPDGTDWSTDQLKGRILHLSFVGPHSADPLLAKSAIADKNVVNIIIPSDSEISDSSACTTGDSSVRRLSAIYSASTIGDSGETQWLVDAEGALRAIWWPGHGEAWTDTQILQQRLDDLERIPAVVRSSGGAHAHHH